MMMEPWSSKHLRRGSRTTLGEMSDLTRRKNSQEVSRLEVKVRHMDRELQVKASDLSHEQLALKRSLTARPQVRRLSVSDSAVGPMSAIDSLKQREKDNMQTLDDMCKNFIRTGMQGQSSSFEGQDHDDSGTRRSSSPSGQTGGNTPSSCSTSDTEGAHGVLRADSPSEGGDSESSSNGKVTPKARRYGIAHATDVHLQIDSPDIEKPNYSPLRRSGMHHKLRRTTNTAGSSSGPRWDSLSQPKNAVRSKREIEAKVCGDLQQMVQEQQTAEEGPTQQLHGSQRQSRRKSLPVVFGRQMMRHDRSSKCRESPLLLPNLAQHRSVSPMADMRVRVTFPEGEEFSSVSDIPFRPHMLRSPRSVPDGGTHSQVSTARGPRLEIDLSIPGASVGSSPAHTSRLPSKSSKREKTYTV